VGSNWNLFEGSLDIVMLGGVQCGYVNALLGCIVTSAGIEVM